MSWLAQRIHAALDASTELLRYDHLSALQLITSSVDLALKQFLLFDKVLEIFKVRALSHFPSIPCQQTLRSRRKYIDLQILFISCLFRFTAAPKGSVAFILCLTKPRLDLPTAAFDL